MAGNDYTLCGIIGGALSLEWVFLSSWILNMKLRGSILSVLCVTQYTVSCGGV